MKVLIVIPPSDFKDDSLKLAKLFMEKWGIGYTIASYAEGEAKGSQGAVQKIDAKANNVSDANYDGIIVVGGSGIDKYRLNEYRPLLDLLTLFFNSKKPVCGIGSGAKPIVRANIVKGKKIMSNDDKSLADSISLFHGIPSSKSFEISGNIITISDRDVSHIENGMSMFVNLIEK